MRLSVQFRRAGFRRPLVGAVLVIVAGRRHRAMVFELEFLEEIAVVARRRLP